MNSKKTDSKTLTALLCSALLLAVFVMQFLPFWHYGEAGELSCSINGYIWFPTDHNDLTSHLQAIVREDFQIEQILVVPILSMLLSAAGCVLCLIKRDQPLTLLLPLACGLVGFIGYLLEPAFRTGSGWAVHMLLYAALAALSVYALMPVIRAIASAVSARLNGGSHGENRHA